MLNFLSPELFDTLVWVVIFTGGAWALWRLYQDLTGPPRWPRDDASGAPPPSSPPTGTHSNTPDQQ